MRDAPCGAGVFFKGGGMDEKLVEFFGKWIKAFESVQAATKEEDVVAAHKADVESRIAATPSEGLRGGRGEAWAASISQRLRRCCQRASRFGLCRSGAPDWT